MNALQAEVDALDCLQAENAPYLAGFLRREDEKLEAAQVRRINAALDEKCRDVEF